MACLAGRTSAAALAGAHLRADRPRGDRARRAHRAATWREKRGPGARAGPRTGLACAPRQRPWLAWGAPQAPDADPLDHACVGMALADGGVALSASGSGTRPCPSPPVGPRPTSGVAGATLAADQRAGRGRRSPLGGARLARGGPRRRGGPHALATRGRALGTCPTTPASTARTSPPAGPEAAPPGAGLARGHDAWDRGDQGARVRRKGPACPDHLPHGGLVSRRPARGPPARGRDPRARRALCPSGPAGDAPAGEAGPDPELWRPALADGGHV